MEQRMQATDSRLSAALDFSMSLGMYSRKVFVGGLPPDIDEDKLKNHFIRFGSLLVNWPHKVLSKGCNLTRRGFAFLIFKEELCVHRLITNCLLDDGKLYMYVSSTSQTSKVQIRPWKLSDSNYIMDTSQTEKITPRTTIFISRVPSAMKACELAKLFDSCYGNVLYAGIACDSELYYPKGTGIVSFSSHVSFRSAVSCHISHFIYGDGKIAKVKVKPYVQDDQVCDKCHGLHCGRYKYAPYFCCKIGCLCYYCEHCWTSVHSRPGQNHDLFRFVCA